MQSKNIRTGIDQLVQQSNAKQDEQFHQQWRDIRNKIDSLLLTSNVLKTDEARKSCLLIDGLTPEERTNYIREKWGPQYLAKVEPLLHQLTTIEKQIARNV